MGISNLELAKAYLHNQLIVFLLGEDTSYDLFKAENQQVINGMNFTASQQEECYEDAREAFAKINLI